MNHLKYENTHYEEALEYTQKYNNTQESGYLKVDLQGRGDQLQIQQNNTIIALLSSIHHRLTLLETEVLNIKTVIGTVKSQDWKQALENINKDLRNLSAGKVIKHRSQTYSFLTYQNTEKDNNTTVEKEVSK